MPAANSTLRRRGFTLLEVLIVVAIFGIVVVTVVALVTSILDQKKQAKGRIDVYDGTTLALATLSFDVANAGYRFPVPAFAIRVVNNVSGATILSQTGQGVTAPTITTTSNCSSPDAGVAGSTGDGLLIGTDVLELAEGLDTEGVGIVAGVTRGGTTSTVRFKDLGTGPSAIRFLSNGGGSAVDAIVLFSDGSRKACLGKVTVPGSLPINPGSISLNFTYLGPDFGPTTVVPTDCPNDNMSAYRLGKRTRYMICQDNTTAIPGGKLYRQTSLNTSGQPDPLGVLNPPTLVLDNIVDLQIGLRLAIPLLSNAPDTTYGALTGPNAICTFQRDRQYCDCLTATPCTGTDQNGVQLDFTTLLTNEKSHLNWVRSAIIAVTSRSINSAATSAQRNQTGANTQNSGMLMMRQTQLFDNPIAPPTANTGYFYATTQQVVGIANFLEVTP